MSKLALRTVAGRSRFPFPVAGYHAQMRKKIALVLFAAFALGGIGASVSPAQAGGPVQVKKECGSYNVYVNGQPLIQYVWCPDNAPS